MLVTVSIDGRLFGSVDAAADALVEDLERQVEEGMVAVSREMQKALSAVYDALEKKHGKGWPTGGAPFGTDRSRQRLSRRSGSGLRSIKDSIRVRGDALQVEGQISTGKLTVHETGAVITAKRSKYLALPMIQALTPQGLPRKPGPRDWRNTFVQRSKRGNLIIFQNRPGGRIVPLYMLKRKVTMPARLGMRKTFEDIAPYFIAKAVRELESALSS